MQKLKSIKYIGEQEQQCIKTNNEDGLYMTDDHIITHNTVFCSVLCAVTLSKAREIYEEPILQLIESADFWKRCRTHQEMLSEDKHLMESDVVKYIPWTTSSSTGVFQSGNNLQWKVLSSAGSLLGLNILTGALTEITFFLEAGKGWTPERIMQFYTKLKQRISNRFQSNIYARFILDSSPSTLEDPIQNYMSTEAHLNKENFVWKGSRWDIYPEEFPEFCNVENLHTLKQSHTENRDYSVAFQLYKGSSGKPPEVCEIPSQAERFETSDLIWCPRKQITNNGVTSFFDKARENPIEFMRDFAGLPSGQPDRIFYDADKIENCFDNKLKSIYGSIRAPAMEDPEHLIWNEIKDVFFYKIIDTYRFYYNHEVQRVLTVDQSESKDMAAISMSHVEYDPDTKDTVTGMPLTVFVTDFVIMISPKGGLVNLDAIKFFIVDLRSLGNINLRHISFDGFEAKGTRQFLDRAGFNTEYLSVDRDNVPYLTWIDLVFKGRWHCGKNIFVKNNMKSLHITKRLRTGSSKIDHFDGPIVYDFQGNFNTDLAGINAKDSTDCIAGNIALLTNYAQEFVPYIAWSKEKSEGRTLESINKGHGLLMKNMNLVG